MNFFAIDLRKLLVTIAIVALSLVIVNVQHNIDVTPWYLKPFSVAAGGLQTLYSSFTTGVRGTVELYLNLVNLRLENRKLANENGELRAQLGAMTELQLENQRLHRLLDFRERTDMELIAARVIGRDLIPDHFSITINRGSFHGLKKGMAAITVGGAVGYIIRLERFTSQVLLLTDRYAAIDAIVQRSRARGIVQGQNRDSCRLDYLQRSDDVVVGDWVVTSGLQNIFPKGFPIGTVKAVESDRYGISKVVELTPAINPYLLEELFVVLNTKGEDFAPQEPAPAAGP